MLGYRAQFAAVATLAAAIALHSIITPDVFWHLASGRWILEHGAVPRTDPLTYTVSSHDWINLQWLTDVALVTLWHWAGPPAIVLAKTAVLILAVWFAIAAARSAGATAAGAGIATMLAVIASHERTMVRPEVVSIAALAAVHLLVYRFPTHRRARWLLPAVSIAWANTHALAFLGPLTMAWHAALVWFDARLPAEWRNPSYAGISARSLATTALVSAVAMCANPYGWHVWTFPRALFERIGGTDAVFRRVLEFARPLDDPSDPALRGFWLLLAVAVASFAIVRPLPSPSRVAAVAPFLLLALLARRNVPLFAVAVAPVIAANLGSLPRVARWVPIAGSFALAAAVLAGMSPSLLGTWRDRGLYVAPGLFPESCAASLDAAGFRGPIFHDMDFGGYLAWRDATRATFIDGRLEVAGPEHLRKYVESHERPDLWRELLSTWRFETLLLQHASTGSAAFLHALLESREWTPWCYSPEAALLVARTTAPHQPGKLRPSPDEWTRLLAMDRGPAPGAGRALDWLADPWHRALANRPTIAAVRQTNELANLCLTLQWTAHAREGYEAVLAAKPGDAEAWLNLGRCDMIEGDVEAARARWRRALDVVPRRDRGRFRDALAELPGVTESR